MCEVLYSLYSFIYLPVKKLFLKRIMLDVSSFVQLEGSLHWRILGDLQIVFNLYSDCSTTFLFF